MLQSFAYSIKADNAYVLHSAISTLMLCQKIIPDTRPASLMTLFPGIYFILLFKTPLNTFMHYSKV